MASSPSGTPLTCSQCNFSNEAERVYCHNCGAKLDRSLLPKPEEHSKESLEKARRRVQKITNPGGFSLVRELKTFANVIVWSVIVAFLLGLIREPDGVPPANYEDVEPRMVSSDLADALESPQPRSLQFSEAEINNYFRSSLKSKASGIVPGVKFQRAYVKLTPGTVHIGLQQSIVDLTVTSGVNYRIGVKDGVFFAEPMGGNFGRVAVHPAVMKFATVAFSRLWAALKRENEQMHHMQNIVVDKGRIILVTKGRTQ